MKNYYKFRETLATLGTQDTGQRQTKHKQNSTQKAKTMNNTNPTKKTVDELGYLW